MIHLTEEIIILKNGKMRKKPKAVSLKYNSLDELREHKKEILEKLNKKSKNYKYTESNVDFRFTESPKKTEK